MREVWLVKPDQKSKAEDALKKDDLVSRQSIFIRSAGALGFSDEGFFIIIDGSDHALKVAEGLLKGMAEKYVKKEKVLQEFDSQEAKTSEAFGFIIGG
jgi:hypothetical protein